MLSARRAWIEIDCSIFAYVVAEVALRKESVDRNGGIFVFAKKHIVALRKESVDRNSGVVALHMLV